MTVSRNTMAFSHISVKKLHPIFAAEISGVDFSSPLTDEVFREIFHAVTEVSSLSKLYFLTGTDQTITVRSCRLPRDWSDR